MDLPLPIEIIKVILSDLPLEKLVILVEHFKEFSFLDDRDFIEMVAIKNNLPFAVSLSVLFQYTKMSYDENLKQTVRDKDIPSLERILCFSKDYKDVNAVMVRNCAASWGILEIVVLMIEKYNAIYNPQGALHDACENGHSNIVKYMLKLYPNFSSYILNNSTAYALKDCHTETVNLLLSHGADLEKAKEIFKEIEAYEEGDGWL